MRADTGDTLDVTWTMADAQAASLAQKQNWRNYPAPMLWARAVSELSTQLFSDVTLGLARYTAEEVGDDEADTDEAALPARAKPPEGWATWDECDAAHDAYLERWRGSDEDVRRKMTAYAKQSGYARPMTRDELGELEGQVDIALGTITVREKPAKAAPVVEVEAVEAVESSRTPKWSRPRADTPVVPDVVAPPFCPTKTGPPKRRVPCPTPRASPRRVER